MSLSSAVAAQMFLLRASGRWRWLLIAPLILLFQQGTTFLFFRGAPFQHLPIATAIIPVHYAVAMLAAAWGVLVWWREPPSRREHTLALPVDVTRQELARILAGAMWVLLTTSGTALLSLVLYWLSGGGGSVVEAEPLAWLSLITGPLLAYTLTVTAATAARRSILVVAAGMGVLTLAYVVFMRILFASPGIETIAAFQSVSLYNAIGTAGLTTMMRTFDESGAVLSEVTEFNVFGASMWISASIIWWSIALAALAFVLWRRRQA